MGNKRRKKKFQHSKEQREHLELPESPVNSVADTSMIIECVRKTGRYSEADEEIQDIISLENDKNQYHIEADALEVSALTEEELKIIEECMEEISASSIKKEDLVFYKDDLEPEEDVPSDLELLWNQDHEDGTNPSDQGQTEGIASFIKGMEKQEFSCQPYVLCQKILRENELCFLDVQSTGPKLCIYNGKHWQELYEENLKQLVYNALPQNTKIGIKAIESLAGNVAAYVRREVRKSYDEGKKRFTEEDFRKISNRIVFDNTVYDLEKGKKCKFTSKKPYSYQINCNYIEGDVPTPYYDKLKADATGGDKESMKMIDYMIAYLLLPNRTGKCFFVMSPARDSGKNILGEFVERLFDKREVRTMDTEVLGKGQFAREGFETARLATCLEMPVKPLTIEAVKELKTFTGNANMEIRKKYVSQFGSQVNFKVLLATNGGIFLPPGEMDEAFFRRVIAIPFVKSTPRDRLIFDLPQKLDEERDAIVSKCVRRFKKVFSADGGIVFPESELSLAQKDTWMGRSLFNEKFVVNMLQFTANEEDAIPKSDVEMIYSVYYAENACNSTGMSKPTYCSRDKLIKLIKSVYPGIGSAKRRRGTISEPDNVKPIPCLTGLQWTDEALELVDKCRQEDVDDVADET